MSEETRTSLETRLRARLSNTLASTGNFFVPENSAITPTSQFGDVLADPRVSKEVDPVALCEFPGHYSFFGSRTILRQVRRTDLYADSRQELLETPVGVPGHGRRTMAPEAATEGFINLLLDETRERVRGCTHLGLLLSGGMDSRIVAAALAELQRSGSEFVVTCFTWGQAGTRDVVYAERIARHYGWGFEQFEIDSATLWDNVHESARSGCFHSGMHLHAMPAVSKRALELGVELMLAGSYGDSIGRAEFRGSHVSMLCSVDHRLWNWFGLIDEALFEQCRVETAEEIDRCRRLYGKQSGVAVVELDNQLHYMRNMLGSAMNTINQYVPISQAFTSRPMVEYMWSLAPECRSDEVYFFALRQLDPTLLELPWARTGKPFLKGEATPDNLKAGFHSYDMWARENFEQIEGSIFSGAIEKSGAFNQKALRAVVYTFKKCHFIRSGRILEIVLWLASLGLILEELDQPRVRINKERQQFRFRHRLQLAANMAQQFRVYGCRMRTQIEK